MNRKLPYEKLIAEQLKRLQLPDKNMLWQKMKAELDAALPVAQKRKPGFNGWWKMSVVFLALLGGTWGIINYWGTKENNILDNSRTNTARLSVARQVITDGTKGTPEKITKQPFANSTKEILPDENRDHSFSSLANRKDRNKENQVHSQKTRAGADIEPLSQESFSAPDINDQQQLSQSVVNLPEELPVLTPYNFENVSQPDEVIASPVAAQYQKLPISNADLSDGHNIIQSGRPGTPENIAVPAYATTLPDVAAKRKLLLREMKKQERKEERELAKSYRTYHSFWGESTDRWFAAGIAPYQNIVVAGQQSYAYNSAAGKNIVTDYIPSPYLQLHVTNRVYLLGEFQFNSPQATPSLLLSQKTIATQLSSAAYTENIYLRKLYYFNMPVSFYYSPVKNFYVGSGLQFSSYNSGLADLEQRSSNNTLLHREVLKLKDDSLSGMIRGSEWRYLFDANYYYNRFMLGVRYSQALSPFADLHINNNSLSSALARNQAFQLYIRYNLVVSGKK
ncbi:MAG: hypothetical protein M9933_00055 [Chitinophagaceae bacterium]|nr:hypothetical protein [Chitinophagaceae bacterium]